MGVGGHGFRGVGPVRYFPECINLSIAESIVTDTLESRSHHGSMFNKSCTLSYEFCTVEEMVVEKPS